MSGTPVVSVKVPPQLFEEVRRSKDEIDWPEEIRTFIQKRAQRWRAEKALSRLERKMASYPALPRGTAAKLIREERDRH